MSAANVYRAAAVIGINPNDLSLWEFHAYVSGWNEAHATEDAAPPPMSDAALEALIDEVG